MIVLPTEAPPHEGATWQRGYKCENPGCMNVVDSIEAAFKECGECGGERFVGETGYRFNGWWIRYGSRGHLG